MDVCDETHIIRSYYAAGWEKETLVSSSWEWRKPFNYIIYQGRQLCYDNQAPSILVNFKLNERSFSLSAPKVLWVVYMPVRVLQFSRIETYVGNMHVCLFISSKTSQIYKSWSLHGFFNNSNCSLLRPRKWSRRKCDPHDVTDWSTDYMLCKTHCVIHRADKTQVSLKNCSKCLCTIDFATIYM